MIAPSVSATDRVSTLSLLGRARKSDPLSLGAREVRLLSREVRGSTLTPDARVTLAGDIVFEPRPEFLEAHLACRGMTAVSYVAPFASAVAGPVEQRLGAARI